MRHTPPQTPPLPTTRLPVHHRSLCLQVVLMACCANLLVYLLEQRARASFITDLICAAQQQQQGQHVQGRQAGPWAGASEEVRQLQLMRRQLRDSLSWRSMVFWLVLLTLASATTWQLACLVYSL